MPSARDGNLTMRLDCTSGNVEPHGRPANTMHLSTEKNWSRSRSHRSLPSKIHAATPPQNLAAVQSLLSVARALGE